MFVIKLADRFSLLRSTNKEDQMSCRFCLIALVVGCLAAASEGNVLYTFTYTATSGPVQSFSFSFTSPTYATDGSLPAFTPFTLTDGANSWTMTQDLVDVFDPTGLNMGCFQFGTPFASLSQGVPPFGGPCSFAVGGPGVNQGAFEFDTSGGLPSALGIYSARDFIGAFDTPA